MERRNTLYHSITEEWKSTDIGPENFGPTRPPPPEESSSAKTDNGDKSKENSPEPWLHHIPLQVRPQPQQLASDDVVHQQRSDSVLSSQVSQAIPLQQSPGNTQERLPTISQESSVPSQQHLRCNAAESRSVPGWPSSSLHTQKHLDIPTYISSFRSSDYKTQVDERITVPKKETDDFQGLIAHLRNQLAQKDREIDTLQRKADIQKPELSCLKEKYSNLQQSFATVKDQLDTTKAMCSSLEKSISEETKERELLKEKYEEQNQMIKSLQAKLQKKISEVSSLENALNVEQSRKTSTQEEAEAVAKHNAREEMAKRFKEDMEKQEELLQLERSKNLETVNRLQLTKTMFEEQKKTLQAENRQLQQLCEQLDVNAQEMMNTIKSQQQELAKKNDELNEMEKEMLSIRMRNEEITCNYQKMIASLKTELLQKNNLYSELKANLEEAGAYSETLQEKLSEASTKIQRLKDEKTALQDRLKKINGEIQKEHLEKQANEEKLIEARQMMTGLRDKVGSLNISHSKEINLLKQTIGDLENILARKDDIIAEQQEEMRKVKCYVCSLESELASVNEQARLEQERHKTICEKAGLLSEFLDKSSETLTEKQQEVWALKQQLEANKRLSPIIEESTEQETSGVVNHLKDKSERFGSSEITIESGSFGIEDLKEELKFKDQCLRELKNMMTKMGLETRQRETELQQEILKLKNVINKKEAVISYQEKMLAQAQYDLSINRAILKEADITAHQKEIEEQRRHKAKEGTSDKKNEESVKTKAAVQDPLLLSSIEIEQAETADEVDSIDSHGSCIIYETEVCLLKDLPKTGTVRKKDPATSTPRKTQLSRNDHFTSAASKIHDETEKQLSRSDPFVSAASNIQAEIANQTEAATKIIKDLEKLGEDPPQPPSPMDADSDKSARHIHHTSVDIKKSSIKITSKNINR